MEYFFRVISLECALDISFSVNHYIKVDRHITIKFIISKIFTAYFVKLILSPPSSPSFLKSILSLKSEY